MGGNSDGGGGQPYEGGYGPGAWDPNKLAQYGQQPPMQFPEFQMPDFGGQQADYQAQLAAQEAERLKTQGLNDRDALYSDYISAASSATDYINAQVGDERSNAALLGIDYNITDTQKSDRISNYFASIWGEGDQSRLEGLFDKWGNPEGFEEFAISRGTASTEGAAGKEKVKGKTKGTKPTLVEEAASTDKLDTRSILGG